MPILHLGAHTVHIQTNGSCADEQPAADAARLDLTGLQKTTHSAGGDSAELPGGLLKGPEQGICHGLYPCNSGKRSDLDHWYGIESCPCQWFAEGLCSCPADIV